MHREKAGKSYWIFFYQNIVVDFFLSFEVLWIAVETISGDIFRQELSKLGKAF